MFVLRVMRLPSWERWSLYGTGKRNAITWFIFQRSLPPLKRGQTFKTAVFFSPSPRWPAVKFCPFPTWQSISKKQTWARKPPLFGVSSQNPSNKPQKLSRSQRADPGVRTHFTPAGLCNRSQQRRGQAATVSPDNWKSDGSILMWCFSPAESAASAGL